MTWSLDPQCLSNMQWRLPSFIRKWTDKTTWKIEKTILKKVHHLFLFILLFFFLLQLLAWRNERIYIYASIHTIIERWTIRLFHIMCYRIWSILDYTGGWTWYLVWNRCNLFPPSVIAVYRRFWWRIAVGFLDAVLNSLFIFQEYSDLFQSFFMTLLFFQVCVWFLLTIKPQYLGV